jgi:hypothetical protein
MIVLPIGAIRGMEKNDLWVLVESLSKSNCLLQILSHALVLKFSPGARVHTNKVEPRK